MEEIVSAGVSYLAKKGVEVGKAQLKSFLYKDVELTQEVRKLLNISDYIYLGKVQKFLRESERLKEGVMLSRSLDDEKAEKVLLFLNGINDMEKIKITAKFLRQYYLGIIEYNVFEEVTQVIERSFLSDLYYLKYMYDNNLLQTKINKLGTEQLKKNSQDVRIIRATSLGIIIGQSAYGGMIYTLEELGELMFKGNEFIKSK